MRLASVRRKLHYLGHITTSTTDRIRIWNALVCPALRFLSQFMLPPLEMQKQIDQLLRNYIWTGSVAAERRSNAVAKQFLILPPNAGGLSMLSYESQIVDAMTMAICKWNLKRQDAEWGIINRLITTSSSEVAMVRPFTRRSPPTIRNSTEQHPLRLGYDNLCHELATRFPWPMEIQMQRQRILQDLLARSDTIQYEGHDRLRLVIPVALRNGWEIFHQELRARTPQVVLQFASNFPWRKNAWIREHNGAIYSNRRYLSVQVSTLADLRVQRSSKYEFEFSSPIEQNPQHVKKLRYWRRWFLSVMTSVPAPHVWVRRDRLVFSLHGGPSFLSTYKWSLRSRHFVCGERMHVNQPADMLTARIQNGRVRFTGASETTPAQTTFFCNRFLQGNSPSRRNMRSCSRDQPSSRCRMLMGTEPNGSTACK